jgi:protein phosphatase
MAAAGQMAQEDVPAYIPKNVITRSLGPHSNVHTDLEGPYDAAAGDAFLLCSDGLSGPISDEELGTILQCLPPEEAVETLVDLANLRGGPDNISVIVAHVDGDGLPKKAPLEAVGDSLAPATARAWQTVPLWLAAGASLGVLLYCSLNQLWVGAIVSAVAMVATFIAALISRSTPMQAYPTVRPLGGPYGNGPYRKAQCPPNGRVVASLADIADKLRELPEKEPGDWSVNWQPFDEQRAAAAAASDQGDYVAAIRQYCKAIRDIMKQVREHRPTVDPEANAL